MFISDGFKVLKEKEIRVKKDAMNFWKPLSLISALLEKYLHSFPFKKGLQFFPLFIFSLHCSQLDCFYFFIKNDSIGLT